MTQPRARYALAITPTARRQLTEHLPEAVVAAAYEFIAGPLLDTPHRVGKQLRPPLNDRHSARRSTYRVIYSIDDQRRTLTVVDGHIAETPTAHDSRGQRLPQRVGPHTARPT